MLAPKEWLRRYRAQLAKRCPQYDKEMLDELTGLEAHEALSAEYPDNPELAVDEDPDIAAS